MSISNPALQLTNVSFTWPKQQAPTLIIEHLELARQQHVFIKGPSGSGKSTLLNLLTGIVPPDQGEIKVLGTSLSTLSNAKRDQFRSDNIGYIFQQFNLLPYLSVIDNVLLPCRFSRKRKHGAGDKQTELVKQAQHLLQRLHLDPSLFSHPITTLSIGQQQRVAAARALIGQPALIIADEPTSSLDQDNRQAFIQLLIEEADRTEATVVFVSHDTTLEPYFIQTLALADINQATQVQEGV